MVGSLLVRLGLRSQHRTPATEAGRETDEWTLAELSHRLDRPQPTLYRWLCRGVLKGRQVAQQGHPLWLIRADAATLEQLQAGRAFVRSTQWPAPIES